MTKMIFALFCACSLLVIAVAQTTETPVCKSDADCGANECCVGLDRRMRRFIFTHPTTGICRPLRYQGHACHVFFINDPFNPNLHVNYCPCASGLECRGTTIDGANTTNTVHHNPKCLPIS